MWLCRMQLYSAMVYFLEVCAMLSFAPFWKTLGESSESSYTLIKNHRISSLTIDKLRKDKPLNTTTINDLYRILECNVADVM